MRPSRAAAKPAYGKCPEKRHGRAMPASRAAWPMVRRKNEREEAAKEQESGRARASAGESGDLAGYGASGGVDEHRFRALPLHFEKQDNAASLLDDGVAGHPA